MNTEPERSELASSPTELTAAVARIEAAPTLAGKSQALWAMTPAVRHTALSALPATLVAALIEADPDANRGLLANIPAEKFQQIAGLGTPAQGRVWLERAVSTGTLAGTILPSLMTSGSLSEMLLTDPDVVRALPKLLNFDRAQRWSRLLTSAEYHKNRDDLLLADADEQLKKTPFRNKAVKAVMQSLYDFVPELYLETIQNALERAKYMEDRPEEWEDLTVSPFALPELAVENGAIPVADASAPAEPLAGLLPEGGDPVFALATAGLSPARKALLEEQLKNLLRQEVVGTASFGIAEMQRAAGRVLFYLRVGLESFGPSVGDATRALETTHLNEVSAIGTRAAEGFRQKSLALSGLRDWLDNRQRQFLDAMKQPEAGIHPTTREPVLWLAGKPKQERPEWHPVSLPEITQQMAEIVAWAGLARAAFGTPERVHTILMGSKTRTWDEALRRTVLALALYRRWEPELVRPQEDYAAFQRQYGKGKRQGIDIARDLVLTALDATPGDVWKPSDARAKARELLLRAVGEIETMPLPAAPRPPRRDHLGD